jgi:hypothetical protein
MGGHRTETEYEQRTVSARYALILSVLLFACSATPTFPPVAPSTGKRPLPAEREFRPSDLAKADIDIVAEAHSQECLASARLLMEKLYRRNPREWRKGNYPSMDAALSRAFDARSGFRFAEVLSNVVYGRRNQAAALRCCMI